MYRTLALILAAALCSSALGAQAAAPCHDAKGKVITCPSATPMRPVCKDAEGRTTRCGSPGSHPA